MGLKPVCKTADTSDDQVKEGNKTSPPLGFRVFNINIDIKFADDPELTKTLYLTPNHLDHFFSNKLTYLDCVSMGSDFLR
jgi:hypothetical protein